MQIKPAFSINVDASDRVDGRKLFIIFVPVVPTYVYQKCVFPKNSPVQKNPAERWRCHSSQEAILSFTIRILQKRFFEI
jgi:hypothetical protein